MLNVVVIAIILSCVANIQSQRTNVTVVMPYAKPHVFNCSGITDPTWYLVNKTTNATTQISTGGKFTVDGALLRISETRSAEVNAEYYCNGTGGIVYFYPNPEPYMYARDKTSTTVVEGGKAEIQCKMIVGFQQMQSIQWVWTLKGEVLVPGDRVTITNSGINNSTSDLVLSKVTLNDKGEIVCNVTNPAGSYPQSVTLRVKNTLAALWPFLAIVGEVIILCIIILIFEKKCAKKNTSSEDEAENLMKQKDNNNSDLKKRAVKA